MSLNSAFKSFFTAVGKLFSNVKWKKVLKSWSKKFEKSTKTIGENPSKDIPSEIFEQVGDVSWTKQERKILRQYQEKDKILKNYKWDAIVAFADPEYYEKAVTFYARHPELWNVYHTQDDFVEACRRVAWKIW